MASPINPQMRKNAIIKALKSKLSCALEPSALELKHYRVKLNLMGKVLFSSPEL